MMRPQFGSPPCQLVFTSALLATARAAASASATTSRPGHAHRDKPRHAFAVTHNHLRQFQADVIQGRLEHCEIASVEQ